MINIRKLRSVEITKEGSVETIIDDKESERMIASDINDYLMSKGFIAKISLGDEK